MARFLNTAPDNKWERMQGAMKLLMTMEGIPVVYYGSEQNFRRPHEQPARQALWDNSHWCAEYSICSPAFSPYDQTNPTYQVLKQMTGVRKDNAPLRRGTTNMRWNNQ